MEFINWSFSFLRSTRCVPQKSVSWQKFITRMWIDWEGFVWTFLRTSGVRHCRFALCLSAFRRSCPPQIQMTLLTTKRRITGKGTSVVPCSWQRTGTGNMQWSLDDRSCYATGARMWKIFWRAFQLGYEQLMLLPVLAWKGKCFLQFLAACCLQFKSSARSPNRCSDVGALDHSHVLQCQTSDHRFLERPFYLWMPSSAGAVFSIHHEYGAMKLMERVVVRNGRLVSLGGSSLLQCRIHTMLRYIWNIWN